MPGSRSESPRTRISTCRSSGCSAPVAPWAMFELEEASGAKDARDGLLELLDLVVEGDTLVVTHIDRLSRGLTYGLQVIEDLHLRGVEFRSLSEDFDTATATGKLQLQMVLAFSEWWRNSIRDRSVAGQAKARAEGRFPGRRPSLTAQQRDYIRVERSKGVSQRELAKLLEVKPLDHPAGGRVGVGWAMQPLHGAWPVGTLPRYAFRTLPANGQTLRRRPLESSRSQSGQVFPHLMARPQITYNFHHYLAVNFVIVSNLIHQRQLAHRHGLLLGFLVAAPRAYHRPQSVNFSGRPVENPRHAVLRVQPVPDRTHQGYEDRQEEKLCQDGLLSGGTPLL